MVQKSLISILKLLAQRWKLLAAELRIIDRKLKVFVKLVTAS